MEAYKDQQTIVILFEQTRGRVRTFLQKTNLDIATEEMKEVTEESLKSANQCKTKGQKDDAKEFIKEKAIPAVKEIFKDFENHYKEFIKKNLGIFVGPVGDKTIEEILEINEMKSQREEITRFNLQGRLEGDTFRCSQVMEGCGY